MKKALLYSAVCAAMFASCAGEKQETTAEPQADAIAWSDTVKYENNLRGGLQGYDVQGYNAEGQLAQVEAFEVKDGKSVRISTIIYKDGKPAYGKDWEGENVVGTDVWTYDANGNIAEEVQSQFVPEKQKIEPTTKYTYTYDAQGNLTTIVEAGFANLRYTDAYEWTYTYDEQGRLTDRKDYTFDGGTRKQANWYTFKYNDKNQLVEKDYYYYDLKTNKLRHDAKTEYAYNEAGQEVKATLIRHKNNQKRDPINSRLYTKEYNEAGQITYDGEQRWASSENNGKGGWATSTHSTSFEYDADGRLVKKTEITNTNKGLRMVSDLIVYGTPAAQVKPTPATPGATIKPVVNLQDKNKTSKEEE